MDEPLWTLRELTAEVATQLGRNYEAADNGQVRAIPDERSVRYYTTIGLVDRPAAMRGRTALYGQRHLAQLVAIKRLQAVGKSLAEIQRMLPTLDDATLSRIAGVVVPERTRAERAGFWRAEPAADSPGPPAAEAPDAAAPTEAPGAAAAPPARAATELVAAWMLPLAPGVTLMLAPARNPTHADAEALSRAADALRAELARRGLITDGE
jgi:DNA-binding transcriptional MerR regulator